MAASPRIPQQPAWRRRRRRRQSAASSQVHDRSTSSYTSSTFHRFPVRADRNRSKPLLSVVSGIAKQVSPSSALSSTSSMTHSSKTSISSTQKTPTPTPANSNEPTVGQPNNECLPKNGSSNPFQLVIPLSNSRPLFEKSSFQIVEGVLWQNGLSGVHGYIDNNYMLRFARPPYPNGWIHKVFTICQGTTFAIDEWATFGWCISNRQIYLNVPEGPEDCNETTISIRATERGWNRYRISATAPAVTFKTDGKHGPGVSSKTHLSGPINSSSLSTAAIAGAAVAVTFIFIFLVMLSLFFIRKWRRNEWSPRDTWRRMLCLGSSRQPRSESPVFEKDSPHGNTELPNRPPTDMIDSTPLSELPTKKSILPLEKLAELPAMKSVTELPTLEDGEDIKDVKDTEESEQS